jgi:hypothetical protein
MTAQVPRLPPAGDLGTIVPLGTNQFHIRCHRVSDRWLAFPPLRSTKLTAGRERCGVGLRLAYWVAQVCNADARDHRRVAKDGWRLSVQKPVNSDARASA